MDAAEIHRQLLQPAAYPDPTRGVAFRETHISRVYLTDHYAYKLKKPLDLGFLDYSTLERRAFFCGEEVRLNRRFAPQVYLGVVELRSDRGVLRFDGPGQVLDYAVRMHRLPEERMLDRLLDGDAPELPAETARLARHLPRLLAASAPCLADEAAAHVDTVRRICADNLRQTRGAIGRCLDPRAHRLMARLTAEQLSRLAPLMRERAAQGRIREGHGDLHARNICMTEPVQVYDCIEFNRRFRVTDSAAELAFLLMDLDFRGRRDLAELVMATLRGLLDDPGLETLLPFYKSYRAWVRGKVEALLAAEEDIDPQTRRQALARARRYFSLALGYHVPPGLLLTAGLMGVGKTTLARELAALLGAELLRSDVIRKELAGVPATLPRETPFGAGLYAPEMTARTYAELRRHAAQQLAAGRTVIVDASFASRAHRQAFFAMAAELRQPAWLLHLHCDRTTAVARLDRRQAEGTDVSDGHSGLIDSQAAGFEPFDPDPRTIEIDSSLPVDYNAQNVLCRLLAR